MSNYVTIVGLTEISKDNIYYFDEKTKTYRRKKLTEFGEKIKDKTLAEIKCPYCSQKMLGIETHLDKYANYIYKVCCDWCDWYCPTPFVYNKNVAVDMFKDWLEVFNLVGEGNKQLVKQDDLSLFLYQLDDIEKVKEYRRSL